MWFGAEQYQDLLLPTLPGAEHAAESPSHPQMASLFPSAASPKSSSNMSHKDKNHLTGGDLWGQSWYPAGARW